MYTIRETVLNTKTGAGMNRPVCQCEFRGVAMRIAHALADMATPGNYIARSYIILRDGVYHYTVYDCNYPLEKRP